MARERSEVSMRFNRVDDTGNSLDDMYMDESDLLAFLDGEEFLQDDPNPSYGGRFSHADAMTVDSAKMPEVEDNWRIVGDKIVFDKDATTKNGETLTRRLIRPEDVVGAKLEGSHVPLSQRNITKGASKDGASKVRVVSEELEDWFGAPDMIVMEE